MSETIERRPAKLGKSKRWVPKKWDIIYDQMIVLSCLGQSHKVIGDQFGYGQQQVCNILNTDEAKRKKAAIIENVRQTGVAVKDRLELLTTACFNNIEAALTDETIRAKAPLAVADRSMAFLKGMGKLDGDKPKEAEKVTNVFLGDSLAAKLVAGIEKANEAALLHNSNGVEVRALPPGGLDERGQSGKSH